MKAPKRFKANLDMIVTLKAIMCVCLCASMELKYEPKVRLLKSLLSS